VVGGVNKVRRLSRNVTLTLRLAILVKGLSGREVEVKKKKKPVEI
jgi:hypothetical protein